MLFASLSLMTHPILGLPLFVVTDDHARIPDSVQGKGLGPSGVIHLDFGLKKNQDKNLSMHH